MTEQILAFLIGFLAGFLIVCSAFDGFLIKLCEEKTERHIKDRIFRVFELVQKENGEE
jgi:hypothetical protein